MNNYHLLVVDDEINRCKMLDYTLTKAGYKVSFTTEPQKAINIFKSENIDVVITDIRMGKMGGIQLLNELKSIDPLINVILITAYGKDTELLLQALRGGAFEFLEKVEDIDLLLNVVQRAIKDRENKLNYNFYREKYEENILDEFIGNDEKIIKIKEMIKNIAPTDSTVLITGESGTGKEIIAKMIHKYSNRKENNFVSINCAAINENLLESELFGHKKGSFTGAYTNKDGLFKVANNGTIFLDEIAEMPVSMQVKLLRVIQEREINPIGSIETIPVNVRIIAATNKEIEKEVEQNRFRNDLFYRLNVIRIHLPALRERKDDIKILFDHYLDFFAKKYNKKIKIIKNDVYQKIKNYNWPGNVRELMNITERIVVINKNAIVSANDIPFTNEGLFDEKNKYDEMEISTLERMEIKLINKALQITNNNKKEAAKLLGINPSTLYRKLKQNEK